MARSTAISGMMTEAASLGCPFGDDLGAIEVPDGVEDGVFAATAGKGDSTTLSRFK